MSADETATATTPTTPLLRVVNADATPEEIAAIVAVFASLGGGAPAPRPKRSEWGNPARQMRGGFHASWRGSALPR